MKALARTLLIATCAALVACDFKVPLVDTPELAIDKAVIGLWEHTKEPGKSERLLVLPLGPKEYLVSFIDPDGSRIYARACLCRAADRTLVQLKWFGGSDGKGPDDDRVYQFATYSLAGDTLRVRLLNSEVVDAEAKSSPALAKAIETAKNNPALFREEMIFKKAKN